MSRVADDYEQRYMAGEGAVLYRDKIRIPHWMSVLLMGLGVAGAVGGVLGGSFLVAGASMLLTSAIWTNFAVLRVTVSQKMLHVQYGLVGPKIPIEDIVTVKAGKYNWLKYGGKGIRFGLDGSTAYNIVGDKGQGVEITYRTSSGGKKTILVAAENPERLAQAILDAQSGRVAVGESALEEARDRAGLLDAANDADLVPDRGTESEASELASEAAEARNTAPAATRTRTVD